MSRQRTFDWDECRRLRAEGWTNKQLAEHFGVSVGGIRLCLSEKARLYSATYSAYRQTSGTCSDCGGPCSHNDSRPVLRCWMCAALARATTVREDELRCFKCQQWKPDDEFYWSARGTIARRGRRGQCRSCETEARRDYRARHREEDRAYAQRYYQTKRKRAA